MPVRRVEVAGESMSPTLLAGDRVLVVPHFGRVRVGDLVVLTDPRNAERTMIKRVAGLDRGGVDVRGDNEAASTDSRHFGPVRRRALTGRVVYRYHPQSRRGWLTPRALRR